MRDFKELKVWQKAHRFVVDVYQQSRSFLARFLSIAAGSASESEYQLLLARDLGYLQHDAHRRLND